MKKIGYTKTKDLLEKGALLVDMRSPVAFRDGHISGAVNLPLRNFLNIVMGMDKKRPIIMYSDTLEDIDLTQGHMYSNNLGFESLFVTTYVTLNEFRDSVEPKSVFMVSSTNTQNRPYKFKGKKKGA